LAFWLARQAARESPVPVLLSEAASDRAGLATLAGRGTQVSLSEFAHQLHDGQTPPQAFVEVEPRLRLLATAPRPQRDVDPDAMRTLLGHARDAHGLVVVDCGTAWAAASPVLAHATHVVWTVCASAPAVARAAHLLGAEVLPAPGRWREALVASATDPRPSASVRALRHLAAVRCERLVIAPYIAQLARGEPADGERLWRALNALAPLLRRERA
jgi:hypothetical protein